MSESLPLGRIRGIRVGINWSLIPIFLLIAWSLSSNLLPAAAPGYTAWGYWIFGLLTTASFYASLLAHELAHALVGQRRGVTVKGIVLWVFGGVAQLEGDTPNARSEFELAAAGPAASLGLAGAGALAATLLGAAGAGSLLVSSVAWLAGINAILAVFNLLPAFPLDGGRILRALLWRHWRDRTRATAVAATVGKIGGFGVIALGAAAFLAGGDALDGIWLVVLGCFIVAAASQQEHVTRRARVSDLQVEDAMTRRPLVVPSQTTVAEAIERYVRPNRFSAFPVVDASGRLVGLATVQRIAGLPRESWRTAPIGAVTAASAEIVLCRPDDPLADVAARIENAPDRRAVVTEGERVVGILTPSDVSRAINQGDPFSQSAFAPTLTLPVTASETLQSK
jgi:Zn-dependent protease/predicted transcriptional regulator